MAEWALAQEGHVDVIVNNAGKSIRRSVELSYDRFHDFERTIGVNYLGPIRLLLALLPAMRARGAGHIVNVSTIGVLLATGRRAGRAYQASKAAFDVWLRSAAPELRTDGVTATSVYMALVHTRMSAPTPIFRHVPGLSAEQAAGADLPARSSAAALDRPLVVYRSRMSRRRWRAAPWEAATSSLLPADQATATAARGGTAKRRGKTAGRVGPGLSTLVWHWRAAAACAAPASLLRSRRSRLPAVGRALRMGPGPGTAWRPLGAAARTPSAAAIVDERGAVSLRRARPPRHRDCRRHAAPASASAEGRSLAVDVPQPPRLRRGARCRLASRRRPAAAQHRLPGTAAGRGAGSEHAPGGGRPRRRVRRRSSSAPASQAHGCSAWSTASRRGRASIGSPAAPPRAAPPPTEPSRLVILTSGTTGAPKGAPRAAVSLERCSARSPRCSRRSRCASGEPILVAPARSSTASGLATILGVALLLGAPVVLRRRFERRRGAGGDRRAPRRRVSSASR